jgi:CBS domain containing-hemolysin-like protein
MPLTWGVILFESPLSRLVGRVQVEEDEEEAFEEEIRSIVTEGLYDGVLAPDAREMIEGVIELADGDVMDIMTPRSNIDAIDIDSPWPEILDLVIESGRTRYPVYEGQLDQIIGILYVKDLLAEYRRGHPRDLRELLRKPSFVPTTKPLNAMLQTFLRAHSHLAIVVDEYQSVAGVVTIEDVLEEIVGEIVDESDKEEENEVRWLSEDTAEVLGTTHVDTVNQEFGLELDEPDDYDTLAGLVISRLGRIPTVGESIQVDGVQFTVIEANRRRINRLLIERDEPLREKA